MESGKKRGLPGSLTIMIACLLAALWASPAWAVDRYWIADDGLWSDPANWNPAGFLPQDGDNAYLTSDDGTSRTVTYDAASYPLLHNLYIDATGSGTMRLDMTTYVAGLFADDEYVGYSGTGAFTQARETNSITHNLYLGYESGSSGTYDLSGTGELSVGCYEYVGYHGTGAFTQSGGTHTVIDEYGYAYLALGFGSEGHGTYELSGGTLEAVTELVGYWGTGEFIQTGGTNTLENLYLGGNPGSGTYDLSGTGELSVGGNENIGYSGTGEFTQSGGTNSITGRLYLGFHSGASGTYDLSGGGLSVGEDEYIGYSGTGEFTQTGGTHTVTSTLWVGHSAGGHGTYELSGTGELSVGEDEFIGREGTGTFTQTGGTHTVTSTLWVGHSAEGHGTYELSGGTLEAEQEIVGHRGTGEFTQTGGANSAVALAVGHLSGSSGTYNLSGGTLEAVTEVVGYQGTGEFTQTGGTHTVTDTLYVGHSAGGTGTFNLTGAEVSAGSINVAETSYLTAGPGGVFSVSGDFINNSLEAGLWDTDQGTLCLTGEIQEMALAGADMGAGLAGYADNFAWGGFFLESGVELHINDGNAVSGAALYVGLISFEDALMDQLARIFSEYNIYYNASLLGNEWLGGLTYDLAGAGQLIGIGGGGQVPIPGAVWLLGSGLIGLLGLRRKFKV